jgi:hypothetical protein
MYGSDDPRSRLATSGGAKAAPNLGFAAAEYVKFHEQSPQEESATARTWYARGQNFVVAYTEAKAGAVLARDNQIDEYMLVVPERGVFISVEAAGEARAIAGHSLVIVPPGASAIRVNAPGKILRVFSARSPDLAARASNAEAYAQAHPHIPPYEAWPDPPGGYRIRAYDLDVPPKEGRFGRIFRCSTLMINMLPLEPGPRDISRLSPHHHDDFEQGSFAVQGAFTHHIRWPWTADSRVWRADDHEPCPAPSLAVIPPPAIHTSAGSDPVLNQLIDIFSPPRVDFSKMPGWVLNADEYPMKGE